MARHHVGDEPFAVLLPDDLMAEDSTVLADMVAAHERTGASVLALKRFGPEEISALRRGRDRWCDRRATVSSP